jgi:hypothetical protein
MNTKDNTTEPAATMRELGPDELDHVTGGMQVQQGYRSKDVIDGRGGEISVMWGTVRIAVGGDGSMTLIT